MVPMTLIGGSPALKRQRAFPGVEGDPFTHPPMMMFARPEQYGIPTKFDDPRTDADDYAERWHATKAKFDRGEEIDSDYGQDVSYEPGDPEPGTPALRRSIPRMDCRKPAMGFGPKTTGRPILTVLASVEPQNPA